MYCIVFRSLYYFRIMKMIPYLFLNTQRKPFHNYPTLRYCDKFDHYQHPRYRFFSNSESFASKLLENIEDICFYTHKTVHIRFNSSITHECFTRYERVFPINKYDIQFTLLFWKELKYQVNQFFKHFLHCISSSQYVFKTCLKL